MVPDEAQRAVFLRACFVLSLKKEWLGEDVTWRSILVAVLCTNLGDASFDATLRKKVGVDKYATTLIARTKPTYMTTLATTHDVHQLVFAYALWHDQTQIHVVDMDAWKSIKTRVESNLLSVPSTPTTPPASCVEYLRSIQIYHYKNPSV